MNLTADEVGIMYFFMFKYPTEYKKVLEEYYLYKDDLMKHIEGL